MYDSEGLAYTSGTLAVGGVLLDMQWVVLGGLALVVGGLLLVRLGRVGSSRR